MLKVSDGAHPDRGYLSRAAISPPTYPVPGMRPIDPLRLDPWDDDDQVHVDPMPLYDRDARFPILTATGRPDMRATLAALRREIALEVDRQHAREAAAQAAGAAA